MKKNNEKILIIRIVLLVSTAISLFYVPWPILRAWLPPVPNTVQEQLEDAIELGFDGIIVYVDQAGKAPAYYGAGYKNRDDKTPANPHDYFKIGSVDKLYKAVSIAQMVNSGQLSLEGTVADYFPEYVARIPNAARVTVRMMVQHRSGLPNFTDTPGFWNQSMESAEEALALIFDLPADFEPNEKYAYCNTNYLLLTLLIEKVTGDSFFQYLKQNILDPLELNHTFTSMHDIPMEELMSGYYVGVEADIKSTDYGVMVATPEDVGVFVRALNDGTLLSTEEQEIYSQIYEYGHGGLIPGYMTYAYYHPDIDAVVVQMVNTTDFEGYQWNIHQIVYNRIVKIISRP